MASVDVNANANASVNADVDDARTLANAHPPRPCGARHHRVLFGRQRAALLRVRLGQRGRHFDAHAPIHRRLEGALGRHPRCAGVGVECRHVRRLVEIKFEEYLRNFIGMGETTNCMSGCALLRRPPLALQRLAQISRHLSCATLST